MKSGNGGCQGISRVPSMSVLSKNLEKQHTQLQTDKMLIDYKNETNHDEVESYQGSFKLTVVKLTGNTSTLSLS